MKYNVQQITISLVNGMGMITHNAIIDVEMDDESMFLTQLNGNVITLAREDIENYHSKSTQYVT